MLFNSYEFILLFLPITLLVYFAIGDRAHGRIAIAWLVMASLFFYGWWNPAYLGLMLASIFINYGFGIALTSAQNQSDNSHKLVLIVGILFNLLLLGYFKYFNFFVANVELLSGTAWHFETVILPLAISFFTFQQISYLVDCYQHKTREYNFLHYALFVTFFPQLIAGPIVHHRDMLPQFSQKGIFHCNYHNLSVGTTIFIIGLFKKVIIADSLAKYANSAFDAVSAGTTLTFFEAWRGAFAYSFQLYFDFSGYSDMAIGLAFMFGIVLPLNFFSPYKAVNIIDFWRRWHMTLSRFLRDYLYIPLGGNRKGKLRQFINIAITMLLGGLWHGAAWNFVVWGGIHGLFIVINHLWLGIKQKLGFAANSTSPVAIWSARAVTLIAITVAWVFFRAENLDIALQFCQALLGFNGVVWPAMANDSAIQQLLSAVGVEFYYLAQFEPKHLAIIVLLTLFVWLTPNTQQLIGANRPMLEQGFAVPSSLVWQPSKIWLFATFAMAIAALLKLTSVNEFLYFQF